MFLFTEWFGIVQDWTIRDLTSVVWCMLVRGVEEQHITVFGIITWECLIVGDQNETMLSQTTPKMRGLTSMIQTSDFSSVSLKNL